MILEVNSCTALVYFTAINLDVNKNLSFSLFEELNKLTIELLFT